MTVGVLCLDGLDWRLASEVNLFADTPLEGQYLRNTLDRENPLFTPRVWTSIMAGTDQDLVTGWLDRGEWRDHVRGGADPLTFFWNRFPDTRVHDLRVCRGGLTRSTIMPVEFTESTGSLDGLKETARARTTHWNAELNEDPQAVISWFGIADRAAHLCGKECRPLRPVYEWLRDELFPALDWPVDTIVVSDHGARLPTDDEDQHREISWAGRNAHSPHGTLATTPTLDAVRDAQTLDRFIPDWQASVAATLRNRQLTALGYQS